MDDSLPALVDRLRSHAVIHEDEFPNDDEQAQWAKDLRLAADMIERMAQVFGMDEP